LKPVASFYPKKHPGFADFESELLSFPYGRHDDQVDAFILFLDWFSENAAYINQVFVSPISITRADPWTADARLVLPLLSEWPTHRGSKQLSSLSFLLCHPKPKAARLVIIDELNSGLLEGRLNFQESWSLHPSPLHARSWWGEDGPGTGA
jgi:hypothetical protein